MTAKSQINTKFWSDSKQIFFTPKLSLEGRNLFPQIAEVHAFHAIRDQPFLNILKKPLMSVYDRIQIRSQKKPVCIVGTPKQVEIRHVRTGNMKKGRQQNSQSNPKKDTVLTCSPHLVKTQAEAFSTRSKQLLPIPNPPPDGSHFYVLGPGNNRQIVEEILKKRQGWIPTTSSIFHLRWEQARPKFQNLSAPHRQVINHLPGHEVISDKGNLLTHLKSYCQKNEELMYRVVPASFILDFGAEDVEEQLKKFISFFVDCINRSDPNPQKEETTEGRGLKSNSKRRGQSLHELVVHVDSPKKGTGRQQIRSSPLKQAKNTRIQIVNDFTKKKEEIKNLYKALINHLKPFYIFQDMSTPKKQNPWVVPQPEDIYGQSSLWLLKPSDLNRGRGIKLFRTVEQLGDLLKSELQKSEAGSFIIQKYLQKPLLIAGRKFDIRVWALVTQNRQLYFFKEGYIRLSSEVFTLDSSSLFTHLTNNAVQKHASNYGQFEEGNILSINYLYDEGYIEKDSLEGQIKRNICLSMKAAGSKIYQPNEKHQSISIGNGAIKHIQSKMKHFEIFGYDFMVDYSKHVWMIQVNTNPCLELSNKLLSCLIPRMLDDAFKLTIDRMFPPKKGTGAAYSVKNYRDDQNMWQLLEQSEAESPVSPATVEKS